MTKRGQPLHCVIMAGGQGTRFWPLSRSSRPKQLLNMFGDKSMLQITTDRLRKMSFVKEIYVVTGPRLQRKIKQEIQGVPPENIIVEPSGKNTAPCVGLAAIHLSKKSDDPVMGVFPADHLIVGHRKFSRALRTAIRLAVDEDALVTFGVVPTAPKTGYGYIQFDKKNVRNKGDAYRVRTFAEKPTENVARRFLKSGDFLWNSGMFVWKASTILNAIEKLMPELYQSLNAISDSIGTRDYRSALLHHWEMIFPKSVDYGILEKADNICVVRSDFQWSDVGSWNSYYEILPHNGSGNVIKGEVVTLDAENNLIYSSERLTTVVGVNDLVVINTKDATLVIPRDRAEMVKDLVSRLNSFGKSEVLE